MAGANHPKRLDAGSARGFTLSEVMIAVAIVTILASIALPSYSSVMVKLNRTAGQQFMIDVARKEERINAAQSTFTATIGSGGLGLTPTGDVTANYSFAIALSGPDCAGAALGGPGYVIRATAIGAQAADGNLCLDSRNNKTPAATWAD
jgi:type IV pilus assembly protein PilE